MICPIGHDLTAEPSLWLLFIRLAINDRPYGNCYVFVGKSIALPHKNIPIMQSKALQIMTALPSNHGAKREIMNAMHSNHCFKFTANIPLTAPTKNATLTSIKINHEREKSPPSEENAR